MEGQGQQLSQTEVEEILRLAGDAPPQTADRIQWETLRADAIEAGFSADRLDRAFDEIRRRKHESRLERADRKSEPLLLAAYLALIIGSATFSHHIPAAASIVALLAVGALSAGVLRRKPPLVAALLGGLAALPILSGLTPLEALPTIILAAAFGWGSTKLTESSIDSFLDWLEALDGGRAQQWLLLAAVVLTWGFSAVGTLPVPVWQLGFFLQYLAGVVAPRPTTLFLRLARLSSKAPPSSRKVFQKGPFGSRLPPSPPLGPCSPWRAALRLGSCARR